MIKINLSFWRVINVFVWVLKGGSMLCITGFATHQSSLDPWRHFLSAFSNFFCPALCNLFFFSGCLLTVGPDTLLRPPHSASNQSHFGLHDMLDWCLHYTCTGCKLTWWCDPYFVHWLSTRNKSAMTTLHGDGSQSQICGWNSGCRISSEFHQNCGWNFLISRVYPGFPIKCKHQMISQKIYVQFIFIYNCDDKSVQFNSV